MYTVHKQTFYLWMLVFVTNYQTHLPDLFLSWLDNIVAVTKTSNISTINFAEVQFCFNVQLQNS